jgi:hypothetical protein
MKKVIVFQVENVLVKVYDEKKMDEMMGRKMVREMVGVEMFEKEFMKEERGGMKVMMDCGEILEKIRDLENRFEEKGDVVKRYWMRDVRRRIEEWLDGKEMRLEEKRRKNMEYGFVKKVIEKREELKDLERICEVVGGRIIFVSGERKSRVEKLLRNNGLRLFEIERDLEFLKGVEKEEIVVIDSVEKLRAIWKWVGLRRS